MTYYITEAVALLVIAFLLAILGVISTYLIEKGDKK